jgi:hypothetical protein
VASALLNRTLAIQFVCAVRKIEQSDLRSEWVSKSAVQDAMHSLPEWKLRKVATDALSLGLVISATSSKSVKITSVLDGQVALKLRRAGCS